MNIVDPPPPENAIIGKIVSTSPDQYLAEGHTVASMAALCNVLLEAGYDHSRPLYVYRGETLSLYTRKSIGLSAGPHKIAEAA
jgi:hypothetical protein